ncbi:MAG: UDP-N-acetylmuramate dehydrogenase [Planctomycetaceae bacterium]|nr:UDP-N-acetylmuramate dehydrogenase [Planctomycetaceae bacterium]
MPFDTGFEQSIRRKVPLASYTWFRLGGPAEYFAEPKSQDELQAIVKRAKSEGLPVRLLGGGSNLLVGEAGVKGVVVHLSSPAFESLAVAGDKVKVGSGAKLGHVISKAVAEGLGGLEALVGIPGTIGGALRCNSGSRSGDIGQWTSQATVMDESGEIKTRSRADLVFSYRESSLDELVILSAEFELEAEDPVELTKRMQKQWIVKKAKTPLGHQATGCIFKNPRGMSAGDLIEQAGLKGARVGGAEVSDRHANFIVADEKATSQDVIRLIEHIRTRVQERLGVGLETEIRIW